MRRSAPCTRRGAGRTRCVEAGRRLLVLVLVGWTMASGGSRSAAFAESPSEDERPAGAVAEEGSRSGASGWWTAETLTGNWGGWRETLEEQGVSLGIVYTGDVVGVIAGGVHRRAEYLDDWDLTLEIDPEPLLGWTGARVLLYGLGLWSTGSPSENAGDVQTLDNIDAPPQWTLYEAWVEQQMLGERLSLLVGLYDVNREFDSIETASLFINSSFGIGKDYSQSGQAGPSIFPSTALGVRLDSQPADGLYARLAVLDGVPGGDDGSRSLPSFFQLSSDDGVLCAAEIGYGSGEEEASGDPYTKVGLGGWFYSAEFERLEGAGADGEPPSQTGNYGVYLLAERALYREEGASERGLNGFARVGFADSEVNPIGFYFGAGAVYVGPIAARPSDRLGLGVAAAIAGHDFERAAESAGTPADRAEVTVELTYQAQITPWLKLQPDLQYIVNPGLTDEIEDALALGARLEITF